MEPVAGRINNGGGDKDDQVLLCSGAGLAAEQAAHQRQIAEHWDLIFGFDDIFGDQSAEDNRLAIPNNSAGGDLAQTEVRQWQLTDNGNGRTAGAAADGLGLRDKPARIVITKELGDGRDDGHLNGET